LSQRAVEPLNVISLTTIFANGPMSLARQHRFISFPAVAITDSTLTINGRQGLPERSSSCSGAIADMHPHNLTGVSIDGEPNPLLIPFMADKRPSLITFHRQAPFF
jgi:hypothetical protein